MKEFILPRDVLKQHLCVLGKTGSGKSSALRYIVEHLIDQGKRVCVIDPKGDWAGLKVGGDGKSPGYAVIGFGDFKEPKAQDVPINERSGKDIAELIATGNRPCIIGFRGWTQSAMIRFWIDFAQTLFNTNSGELYLVGDEFHNFAAKGKILDPEAGKCLHWSNRLMSEGRGYGLVCLIASQRPQKVHNDTLTCCETLIAMRVIHKADRDAVQDWIDGCGDSEKGKEVLNSLAGMERGEAYVWSPEINFGPKRLTFPMFKTFDSFAPPQLQKAVSTSGWSTVDLSAVKEKLAAVIEEHQQNDPTALKREIAALKKQLAAVKPTVETKTVEVAVITEEQAKTIGELRNSVRDLVPQMKKFLDRAEFKVSQAFDAIDAAMNAMRKNPRPDTLPLKPAAIPHRAWANGERNEAMKTRNAHGYASGIRGGMRRMMIALAQRPGLNKRSLGVRAGLSSRSGTFGTYLGTLRSEGLIDGNGENLRLTQTGLHQLGDYEPLPSGEGLFKYWLNELGGSGAGRMLKVLFEAYPKPLTKQELGEAANISPTSGSFGTYLGTLRSLELVEGKTELSASPELFE